MHGTRQKGICQPKGPLFAANTCWDNSQAMYDLVKQVVEDLFENDPTLVPPPPGVTDGSLAAPGQVGEVWSATAAGGWSQGGGTAGSNPPGANLVIAQPPLPAGDWDLSWRLSFPYSASSAISAAMLQMTSPLPPGALNDMSLFGVTIPNLTAPVGAPGLNQASMVLGPSTPISTASVMGLVFNLFVWPQGIAQSGTYTAIFWARRRR